MKNITRVIKGLNVNVKVYNEAEDRMDEMGLNIPYNNIDKHAKEYIKDCILDRHIHWETEDTHILKIKTICECEIKLNIPLNHILITGFGEVSYN